MASLAYSNSRYPVTITICTAGYVSRMRQKEGKGELCISVQALDDKLMEVSVRDNGVGIPEDKIRLILEGGYKTSKSGFGLHSVKQRVELFYGIEDAVSISSQPGCWTEVRVRFSYKTDG